MLPAERDRRVERGRGVDAGLGGCEAANGYQACEDVTAPCKRSGEMGVGIVGGRGLQEAGEESSLTPGQLRRWPSEVVQRRAGDAVGAIPEVGGIQVHRQDFLFGEVVVELEGHGDLLGERCRGGAAGRVEELRKLDLDRCPTQIGVGGHETPGGADGSLRVESRITVEPAVLSCQHGRADPLWHDSVVARRVVHSEDCRDFRRCASRRRGHGEKDCPEDGQEKHRHRQAQRRPPQEAVAAPVAVARLSSPVQCFGAATPCSSLRRHYGGTRRAPGSNHLTETTALIGSVAFMQSAGRLLSSAADAVLEASIVGSFTRIGFDARRRSDRWHEPHRLDGRTIVVTGASSGIGRAVATGLGMLGAKLWLTGRNEQRLAATARSVESAGGNARLVVADLVIPSQVDDLVERMSDEVSVLDGIVHNAGALFGDYRQAPDGTELTVATHVIAPFRLTELLVPRLRPGRSILVTVSSGGMYTERFDLAQLEMSPVEYRGTVAYARAKRAQVVLASEWQRRLGPAVSSYSTHPGWVNTEGLQGALAGMSRLGPLLRSPAQGADTIVWLVGEALAGSEVPPPGFWHDRRRRGEYYRPGTRPGARQALSEGEALWEWCASRR